jgi:pilus assembly protein CpaB
VRLPTSRRRPAAPHHAAVTARSPDLCLSGRRLRRALSRYRRPLGALLLAGAVVSALAAVAPPPAAVTAIVVAARDLSAGQVLVAGDLTVLRLPPAASPDGAVSEPAALTGRTVAAAMRRGEPITDVRLVGPGLLRGDTGLVAAPVRLADAAATSLVRPGDLVDVLSAAGVGATGQAAAGAPSARLVAVGARVLAVPPAGDQPVSADDGALVVLAVSPDTARALAGAAAAERLSLVIRSSGDR